jgi:hypothetical protein
MLHHQKLQDSVNYLAFSWTSTPSIRYQILDGRIDEYFNANISSNLRLFILGD